MKSFEKFHIHFLALISCAISQNCDAQQFRCETDVYQSSQSKPVAHKITIFRNNKIYDLSYEKPPGGNLQTPIQKVIVFDQARKTITIINPKKNIFLQVSNQEVARWVASLKMDEVIRKKDPFILDPKLVEKVFPESQKLQLKSDRISYHCKGKDEDDPKTLSSFYYYMQWSTNLIASEPGHILPFARTKLNLAIEKQAWLPVEVEIIDKPLEFPTYKAKAKLHYTNLLSKIDHQRVKAVDDLTANCKKVSLKEFRRLKKNKVDAR